MRRSLTALMFLASIVAGCGSQASSIQPSSASANSDDFAITWPADGAVSETRIISVTGSAPDGARIVRDIPFALDAQVGSIGGRWSMSVDLAEGENELTLRIGDEKATAKTITVTYRPTAKQSPTPSAATDATAMVAPSSTARPAATPVSTRQPAATPTPAPLGHAPIGATEIATVLRVVDGDTIEVDRGNGPEMVRYIGMDTPETVAPESPVEWMGPQASAANKALVEGRDVLLERDVSETDKYDRLLRYVWVEDASAASGWLLVNLALVAKGYAQVSTYPPDVRYVDLYLEAQRSAEAAGLGLWGPEPTPKPTPKPTPRPTPKPTPRPTPTPRPKPPAADCHPSYAGVCLTPGIGDYDCAGGSGNGPNYAYGPIRVVGPDEFDLDRDNDGIGCE
jgi:micrococcal nuclease